MNEWPRTDPDGVKYFEKDPDAICDFGINWAAWLTEPGNGATIATSVWSVPTGITLVSQSNSTTATSMRVSGGTIGISYACNNRITTNTGLVEDRVIRIKIVEKISR
jgi:hypothetical protein